MTLEEKVGQMNMPCVYEAGLGRTIPEKHSGVQKFAAGTLLPGFGPGGGFFTLSNEILHDGTRQQAEFLNRLQGIAARTRLGIPLLESEEGTHGLMCAGGTIFPEGPALGSTWNMELLGRVYAAVAREARAIGVHQTFTQVIEPIRDPRLGRNEEAFSEDPLLCARIAEAIVRAEQGPDMSAPDKVVTGLCHYPGQSQPVSGFERGAMEVSERTLREVFLPSVAGGHSEVRGPGRHGHLPGHRRHPHPRLEETAHRHPPRRVRLRRPGALRGRRDRHPRLRRPGRHAKGGRPAGPGGRRRRGHLLRVRLYARPAGRRARRKGAR